MIKPVTKKNNNKFKKNEKKSIEELNKFLCMWNYILILILFNLSCDGIFYIVNKKWWLEWMNISYDMFRFVVKILIPLVLAFLISTYKDRLMDFLKRFVILNFWLFIVLILFVAYIYILTGK